MTNINIIRIISFAFLITLIACGKEPQIQLNKEFPSVEQSMWSYFAKFEKEAAERGLKIDLATAGITGSIEKIHARGTVGLCNHRLNEPNHVIIDINFWNTASENSKEMIIYHELGHCFLERGHKDDKKSDGTCASIMRSGKSGCIDFYTNTNKDEYLDELYKEATTN